MNDAFVRRRGASSADIASSGYGNRHNLQLLDHSPCHGAMDVSIRSWQREARQKTKELSPEHGRRRYDRRTDAIGVARLSAPHCSKSKFNPFLPHQMNRLQYIVNIDLLCNSKTRFKSTDKNRLLQNL